MNSLTARIPPPGPSFIREERVDVPSPTGNVALSLGLRQPSVMDDGWWLTTAWAADNAGVVDAASILPAGAMPPEAPVALIGRSMAGALAGLLDQEDGRQLIRLRMPPAPDESQPWSRPLILWIAVRWDPIRASVLRANELARELLRAFARAIESVG